MQVSGMQLTSECLIYGVYSPPGIAAVAVIIIIIIIIIILTYPTQVNW
jgi:hypothetical protein